jgi:hypothetical protein
MSEADDFRQKAAKARRLIDPALDKLTVQRLTELAEEYEASAERMDRPPKKALPDMSDFGPTGHDRRV